MFAFAYYEGATRRLHLARDRFGEKPLHYLERNGVLVFGSEPKAVLAHPASRALPVDPGAVATYLAFEYLPGSRSLRAGLRKLPPGHRLVCAPGGSARVAAYWRPAPDEHGFARAGDSESQRLDHLDALMDESVRTRLVADVPVGVFLSGGIDSSLVAAYVARNAPGLTAFTVQMPEASYDETPAAATLARALGLDHEIIALDDRALLDAFAAVTARMDEPLADPSLLPTWALSRATRERVTVALGGDGADELFAGYISFKANRAARMLALLPQGIGQLTRSLVSRLPQSSTYMSPDFLLRQLSQGFGVEPARQWAACMAPFASEDLHALWLPEARSNAEAASEDVIGELMTGHSGRPWSTAELIRLFASTYLPEDILHKVDRASMYVSLEVRTPYLGRALAEYAMSLPSRDKIRGLHTKHLFRELALRYLPRETVDRRKHGFALPLSRLLRGPLKAPVGEAILGHSSPLREWFRRPVIERLWSEHQSCARDHRKRIWTLFCLAAAVVNTASDRWPAGRVPCDAESYRND
jgi:asparagine synthase (glutamine-hydrolysing)